MLSFPRAFSLRQSSVSTDSLDFRFFCACRFAHAGESLWEGISLLVVSDPVFLSLEAVVVVAVVVCTGKIGCQTFTSVPLPKA